MTKKYVLTNTQFTRVILAGMVAAGQIPENLITADADKSTRIETTENGVIIELGAIMKGQAAPSEAGSDEGPASETVKEALAKAMENPPWLNSINSWDAKKKRAALKWAKNPTASARPPFIHERKQRGGKAKKKSAHPPAEEAAGGHPTLTAPQSKNGLNVAKEMFEREETAASLES